MPSVNPGPALTQNANTLLELTPINTVVSTTPVGSNALRVLAIGRTINILSTTGDIAVLPIINTFFFQLQQIIFTNPLVTATGLFGSAAACTVSVNGGAAVTGRSLVASAALTNLTGAEPGNLAVQSTLVATANTAYRTATLGTSATASNFIYLNSTVVSATANTLDLFVYGYDLS